MQIAKWGMYITVMFHAYTAMLRLCIAVYLHIEACLLLQLHCSKLAATVMVLLHVLGLQLKKKSIQKTPCLN